MKFITNLLFKRQTKKINLILKVTVYVAFVVVSAVYFGNVAFGNRSYEVLQNLKKEKVAIFKDIRNLKEQNARLQKIYLEKIALDPDFNKKMSDPKK